ncbi:probable E3 ubiquitin-protein ligase RHC1A [Corylus avellana]|uniref:probable E3 ubiquitin-protein ligase RHC1A n=1 Tax=Corylus avellana TaxID=13451 RepID=UPI00286D56A9|nr:probable E3 ubiquitin-protein ligase RHC1A [Corylus avellana]
MATSTGRWLSVDVKRLNRVQEAKPTGMVKISFIRRHLKLRRASVNDVVVFDDRRTTLRPDLFLQVPNQVLLHPPSHENFISASLSTLGLPICPRCSHDHTAERIVSHALRLAAAPTGLMGYFMAVELRDVKVEHFAGTSRRAIEKLMEKGGFVAEKSDQELGTCSICLDELISSSDRTEELLRMDCSHLYHQSCILPWLEKQNTCPYCRREVEEEE